MSTVEHDLVASMLVQQLCQASSAAVRAVQLEVHVAGDCQWLAWLCHMAPSFLPRGDCASDFATLGQAGFALHFSDFVACAPASPGVRYVYAPGP